ncbi:hypothetical protein BGX26_012803 [Mortierella sp. AD094]|nr:hypothetical protein BGX26_012803 [Mortierella sp. AD094]
MAENDQNNNDSSILKYMMQDFGYLSIHQTYNTTPSTRTKATPSSDYLRMPTLPQPTRVHQTPNFGTNSLFLTDYEKHEWLGSGQLYGTEVDPKKNRSRDLVASNETKSDEFSLFLQEMPQTPNVDRLKDIKPAFPDSGFVPWRLDTEENESVDLRYEYLTNAPTANYYLNTRTQSTPHIDTKSTMSRILEITQSGGGSPVLPILGGKASGIPLGWACMPKSQALPRTQLTPTPRKIETYSQTMGTYEQVPSSFTNSLPGTPMRSEGNLIHPMGLYLSGINDEQSFAPSLNKAVGVPTRYIKVINAPRDMSIWKAREALKNYGDLKGVFTALLRSDGILFFEFFDIRHAMAASRRLHLSSAFNTANVSPDILKNDNEGILAISVTNPRLNDNDMLHLLASYGDVRSFQTESNGWPLVALVEYYDIRHAAFTKSILQELQIKQGKLNDDAVVVKTSSPLERLVMASSWLLSSGSHQRIDSAISGSPTDQSHAGQHPLQSRTTPHCSPIFSTLSTAPFATGNALAAQSSALEKSQEPDSSVKKPLQSVEPVSCISKSLTHDGEGQQRSSVQKAQSKSTGALSYATATCSSTVNTQMDNTVTQAVEEKRTTYMIRNIPNKYTQQMLVECINETHFGKYDFLYLRMDFKNKCNVGYAFINFINTNVVDSFIDEHAGKKWSRFNSDKICRLSFAAIQGKQALIEKFRNSRYCPF